MVGSDGSAARNGIQQDCGIRNAACQGARRILAVCDGNDAVATDQAETRLDPHDAIDAGRANDGAIGFRANGKCGQVGRNGDRRAAGRSAGVAARIVRISGLSTDAAPAARRSGRAKVGPFAQVGFAQDDRTRVAQSRNQKSVIGGAVCGERQRTGGRVHAITGVDVGFQHDGDSMQWPARAPTQRVPHRGWRQFPAHRD